MNQHCMFKKISFEAFVCFEKKMGEKITKKIELCSQIGFETYAIYYHPLSLSHGRMPVMLFSLCNCVFFVYFVRVGGNH